MINFALRWCANAAALAAVVKLFRGIRVDSLETVALAALALGLVNAFVRPALIMLSLPLTVRSFGLFILVINAALFYAISRLVPGLTVSSAADAFWGSLVFGMLSFLFNLFLVPARQAGPQASGRRHAAGSRPSRRRSREVIDVEGKVEEKKK